MIEFISPIGAIINGCIVTALAIKQFWPKHNKQLIKVTPRPKKITISIENEMNIFLDIKTTKKSKPLCNCRVKLLKLESCFIYFDKNKKKQIRKWKEDLFYSGQTYFFSWSGKPSNVEATNIPNCECVSLITSKYDKPELTITTTPRNKPEMFSSWEYHFIVEITADNSLPLTKEYWIQMYRGNQEQDLIKEWSNKLK